MKGDKKYADFKSLGIKDDFIKGLDELRIKVPSEIQSQVIPVLMREKTDLIGQAQTGTGKTAAFGLPLLHKINPNLKEVQALILCPTRELGQQVAKQLFKYTKYTAKIFTEAVYGGPNIEKQIKALSRPTHIIVATPGRLIDLVERKAVDLSKVKTVVLDEADEMLSMGFKDQLEKVMSFLPEVENKWLFSATLNEGVRQIINKQLSEDAVKVIVKGKNVINRKIEHQFLICDDDEKLIVLLQFLKTQKKERGVIFCKTKAMTKKLAELLSEKKIPADGIHGDLLQKERDKVMRAFKNGKLQILVATDLAARGIDVPGLAYVVHYQLPDKEEYYTHRSGRTARAGEEGLSFSLINSAELKNLRHFEKLLDINFKQIRKK